MAKDPKNRETAAIILQAMKDRRSIRNYTGEAIPKEDLELIVEAGLTSASGHADYPWDIVVVQDLDTWCRILILSINWPEPGQAPQTC